MRALLVVVVMVGSSCLGRLVAPRQNEQRQPGRQLQLPADWSELWVAHLEEEGGEGQQELQLQQLLAAARNAAVPAVCSRLRHWQNLTAADAWLRLAASRDVGAGASGLVLAVSALTAESASRFLLPPGRPASTQGYMWPGALLLLLLAREPPRPDHALAEHLLRHRGAVRLAALTPGRTLRLEPFAQNRDGGWGELREVAGLAAAAHAPSAGVLGRMAGFPLVVVQEPRDDDYAGRDWRASWAGQVLSLVERQLRCSLRLYRT